MQTSNTQSRTTHSLKIALAAAAALVCGAAIAQAPITAPTADGAESAHHHFHHRHGFGGGVERVAMHNLIAQQLSQRTGRSQAEIESLFRETPRGQFAEKLGLDHNAMREVFVSARQQYVEKSRAAGLITDEQATRLLQSHHHHEQQS